VSIDGRTLAKAKAKLEEKRSLREVVYRKRLEQAYETVPKLRGLDVQIRQTMTDLVGLALGVNVGQNIEEIRELNLDLQEQRYLELKKAGFSEDFLDESYMCRKCNDTGYVDSKMCTCLSDLYKDELRQSLSSLLKLGDETFDSFDLNYYDATPSADTGIPARRVMEIIYETCVEYARKFGKSSMNLFFNGAPGLGKTFLSACIARVVAEKGYSVVYEMAGALFSRFEDAKFGRTDDTDTARQEIKRYMECDLLILDDLGTEMTTVFIISALYELINTRLITGKKTIISSNLTTDELKRKYSEQIMSRLEGEYQVLTFRGSDIRQKKNVL